MIFWGLKRDGQVHAISTSKAEFDELVEKGKRWGEVAEVVPIEIDYMQIGQAVDYDDIWFGTVKVKEHG